MVHVQQSLLESSILNDYAYLGARRERNMNLNTFLIRLIRFLPALSPELGGARLISPVVEIERPA